MTWASDIHSAELSFPIQPGPWGQPGDKADLSIWAWPQCWHGWPQFACWEVILALVSGALQGCSELLSWPRRVTNRDSSGRSSIRAHHADGGYLRPIEAERPSQPVSASWGDSHMPIVDNSTRCHHPRAKAVTGYTEVMSWPGSPEFLGEP